MLIHSEASQSARLLTNLEPLYKHSGLTVEERSGHSDTEPTDRKSEVLTDSGHTVEDSSGHSDTEPTDRKSEVLTDSGHTVEDSSGHSETEQTEGKMRGTDRQWTDCRKEQWS